MNKYRLIGLGFLGLLNNLYAGTYSCPNPETTSLQWGEPPVPWVENPFSEHSPQGEANTRFVRANILETGPYGVGVLCTYQISIGYYSIWWPVLTKIPAPVDYRWIDTPGGYVCTEGLTICQFTVAQ